MKGVPIKNLGRAWHDRATHLRGCEWTKTGREIDCNCGFHTASIYAYFKADTLEMLEHFAAEVCPNCNKSKVVKNGNGYYHSNKEPNVFEDWCEASALYLLMDRLLAD